MILTFLDLCKISLVYVMQCDVESFDNRRNVIFQRINSCTNSAKRCFSTVEILNVFKWVKDYSRSLFVVVQSFSTMSDWCKFILLHGPVSNGKLNFHLFLGHFIQNECPIEHVSHDFSKCYERCYS